MAKREEARRMVPSPPKVVVRSTFLERAVVGEVFADEEDGECGSGGV